MRYWLVKSEADLYSIEDFKRDKVTHWSGVRNYQARNFLKEMRKGDRVAFYESNCDVPGVKGTARVVKEAYPDPSQFDEKDPYYDMSSEVSQPRWFSPDLKFECIFNDTVSLEAIKGMAVFKDCQLVKRGNRLSVLGLTGAQFIALEKAGSKAGQARKKKSKE